MRRFFAAPENFNNTQIELIADESKHLRDVLRLQTGEKVAVFDGRGNEFACLIETVGRKNQAAKLRVLEKIDAPAPESSLNLTLAVGLLKGEKFDLVIQKATELGVKRIISLATKRSDVKIKDEREAAKKLERWRRIALEAAKQSGRAALPIIEMIFEFEDFVSRSAEQTRVLFAERAGKSLTELNESVRQNVLAVVGAEGGWDDSEIEAARRNDFQIVTLGGRVLRAETAAIVFTALLQHSFGDLK